MKTLARCLAVVLALIGLVAIVGGFRFAVGGVSARPDPAPAEVRFARAVRHRLVPAQARGVANPVPASPAALADGMAHFADHCATCHGNDGRGRTLYGRRMRPRAPDMTAEATQSLADGELFWIIENGVRMTGMPGFGGDPESHSGSWALVHFIRHLPGLKPEELAEMERLNPSLSRAEVERAQAGEPAPAEAHRHDHPH